MNFFVKLWILVAGICLPAFVLAHESGHIGGSMMGGHTMLGMGIMGIFIWTLVVVLLVLAILVCLKYLRNK